MKILQWSVYFKPLHYGNFYKSLSFHIVNIVIHRKLEDTYRGQQTFPV